MIPNKIPFENDKFYKKGDSVNIQATDGVWAGYMYHTGTGVYVTFILDKPILASGASITVFQSDIGITTITGLRNLHFSSVTDISIKKNLVSCVINGTFDAAVTKYSPVTFGVTASITFT